MGRTFVDGFQCRNTSLVFVAEASPFCLKFVTHLYSDLSRSSICFRVSLKLRVRKALKEFRDFGTLRNVTGKLYPILQSLVDTREVTCELFTV